MPRSTRSRVSISADQLACDSIRLGVHNTRHQGSLRRTIVGCAKGVLMRLELYSNPDWKDYKISEPIRLRKATMKNSSEEILWAKVRQITNSSTIATEIPAMGGVQGMVHPPPRRERRALGAGAPLIFCENCVDSIFSKNEEKLTKNWRQLLSAAATSAISCTNIVKIKYTYNCCPDRPLLIFTHYKDHFTSCIKCIYNIQCV